jgi:hypothetical protein
MKIANVSLFGEFRQKVNGLWRKVKQDFARKSETGFCKKVKRDFAKK